MAAFVGLLFVGLLFILRPAFAEDFPIAYCGYSPTDSLFRTGKLVIQRSIVHGGANYPGSRDGYQIILPDVAHPVREYPEVKLGSGDTFIVKACGCVQTGGNGKTWKRYVDPSGPNSDRLYHGLIGIYYDHQTPPVGGWTIKGMRTIQSYIDGQGPGTMIPKGHTATLLLGYQDDDYSDNGYWGHDDGTDDQCRGVGGAAVEVIVTHH
jgi:hypothetical protein